MITYNFLHFMAGLVLSLNPDKLRQLILGSLWLFLVMVLFETSDITGLLLRPEKYTHCESQLVNQNYFSRIKNQCNKVAGWTFWLFGLTESSVEEAL